MPASKRGSFGKWDTRVSGPSWVMPLVVTGVVVPLLILGIWWFLEGDSRVGIGEKERETASPTGSSARVEERSAVLNARSSEWEDVERDRSGAHPSDPADRSDRSATVASEPESPDEILSSARQLVLEGSFKSAQEELRGLVDHPEFLRKNRGAIENLKGSILHRQGDPAGAVSHFVRARAEDRWNPTFSLNLAESLRAAGMVRLTEAALLDALEVAPDAFLPNVRYRFFLIQTGRREQVVEEIRAVEEKDRNGLDVLAVAAALHATEGSYDKVDRILRRIRAEAGDDALAVLLSDPLFEPYRAQAKDLQASVTPTK